MSNDLIFRNPPYLPGKGAKPNLPHATTALSEQNASSHEIFQLGFACHTRAYYWEAHELWESLWHLQIPPIKDLIKILIQRSAAELKILQNDREAANRLFRTALLSLRTMQLKEPHWLGVDWHKIALELESKLQGEARST